MTDDINKVLQQNAAKEGALAAEQEHGRDTNPYQLQPDLYLVWNTAYDRRIEELKSNS